jgi:hypothetical protein
MHKLDSLRQDLRMFFSKRNTSVPETSSKRDIPVSEMSTNKSDIHPLVQQLILHVHTVYMHVHTLYIGTLNYLRVPFPRMPVCTALVMCLYYAIIQEYDVLYVLSSDMCIPP